MAVRASIATGNFLTAGTWGLVDATLYATSETTTVTCPTAYSSAARSAQQTPGAITVSHIGVKLSVRTGTTGTITVHIADSSHVEVGGTAVTINTADLPVSATADINGGWVFFKLSSPVTLSAATLYEVEAQTSSASQVGLFASASTNGLACALITTTTGAPAAGDDLIVAGEYTGAGTSNSFTVTMDETATTDYGSNTTSLVTPSLAICSKGTLTYGTTSATNYVLRQSGHVIVYSGGTLNIGTTGTPMPRDSSAVLEFDCAADGDFGLVVRNGGTFNAQGQSRTSGKNITSCKLNTDEAVNSTSLGVDTDTGWLDNDEIAIASTTRTASQCEKGTLNGNAGASSLTVDGFGGAGGGLANAHSGTSPTQADVILLTRNVRIRAVTSTLVTFCNFKATATIDCDWVEFYYMGNTATGERGVEVETTTASSSFIRCSFHDFDNHGLGVTGATADNVTVQYCVFYNMNTAATLTSGAILMLTATSGSTITFDNNIIIRVAGSSGNGFFLNDIGAAITNNIVAGVSNFGYQVQESGAVLGTFSGNTAYACTGGGFSMPNAANEGTVSNFTAWRNNAAGIYLSTGGNLVFDTIVLFGNNIQNISIGNCANILFKDVTSNGDTTFSTASGIAFNTNSSAFGIVFTGADFSTVSGIKTAHTNDVLCLNTMNHQIVFHNSKLGGTNEVASQSTMINGSFVASQKHDQTAGLHKTWKKYGTIAVETTIKHTGSTAFSMTPNTASKKLESGSFFVAVANGATLTPSVYSYENATYNGGRMRLILKKNVAIGISADTVIDTRTGAADAVWEQLTGTTAAATDDGVMEFVIDCDGTAGVCYVDTFTCS